MPVNQTENGVCQAPEHHYKRVGWNRAHPRDDRTDNDYDDIYIDDGMKEVGKGP